MEAGVDGMPSRLAMGEFKSSPVGVRHLDGPVHAVLPQDLMPVLNS